MLKTILVLHLAGALGLAALMLAALLAVLKNRLNNLKSFAANIGVGLGLQLVTGSLLVWASRTPGTVSSFCSKIGIYLAVVAAVEGLLFYKIRQSRNFPAAIVASSALVGVGFAAMTLAFGF
ncbi:MAG: hypothetical protein JWO40_16 [Candidatus Doudnabacteria bacterium]|nr:hypothetical protein [Candidatus Doudnabacteria bacterium]